jgi:glucose-1-phosphate thymidylyltransferase
VSGARAVPLVGLLPAAGRGVRFGASGYIKELFPLLFTSGAEDRILEPRPLCEMALRAIRAAGAERCLVLVSPEKMEILRVLGAGAGVDLALAYMIQPEPRGLPHAVRCARPWLGEADVVFAMPDTIVLPSDALRRVHEFRLRTCADLTLGVFPVDEPERFGPVEVAPDGTILRILDKPPHREVKTVWGVCAWAGSFTRFCAEWDAVAERERPAERVLSNAFDSAREAGLLVNACAVEDGVYLDIGTPRGLREALRSLIERGVLEQVQAALGATDA